VIAAIDPRKGEIVKAVVVLRDGIQATADDIMAWSREHMARLQGSGGGGVR